MSVILFRGGDGRIAGLPDAQRAEEVKAARAIYDALLAAICRHQGLSPNAVTRELARPGKTHFDTSWRAACYARQLALYLAHVEYSVLQSRLADALGMTKAAVCLAVQAIEDQREVRAYDVAVDLVAAQMTVTP